MSEEKIILMRLNAVKKRLLQDAELAVPTEKYPTYRSRVLDAFGDLERELKGLL